MSKIGYKKIVKAIVSEFENGIVLQGVEYSTHPLELIRRCKEHTNKDVVGFKTELAFEDFFVEIGKAVYGETRHDAFNHKDVDFLSLLGKVSLDFEVTNDYYIDTKYNTDERKIYLIKAGVEYGITVDDNAQGIRNGGFGSTSTSSK